ncbi:hypothetical protein AVEN_201174-1 [Araneus ventricosus]|uniref:Uncharacterized protein n=1 Tax=Araneus ventricosus TaxID=182803 RepID=A0A4Y2KDA2_ARAVE|nr:hypothetical protein AVEN_201174-1 [Araneus ventricosus]
MWKHKRKQTLSHNANDTPLHYSTQCILTASFNMTKPAQQHELIWFRNVASNKGPDLNSNECYTILMIFKRFFEEIHDHLSLQDFSIPASRHWEFFVPSSSM